jgi:hypothetical protein
MYVNTITMIKLSPQEYEKKRDKVIELLTKIKDEDAFMNLSYLNDFLKLDENTSQYVLSSLSLSLSLSLSKSKRYVKRLMGITNIMLNGIEQESTQVVEGHLHGRHKTSVVVALFVRPNNIS